MSCSTRVFGYEFTLAIVGALNRGSLEDYVPD